MYSGIASASEITIELTDYCPHKCRFCSSNATDNISEAVFLTYNSIKNILTNKRFDHIILSGGEPLSHPEFYRIYKLC